MVCGRERVVNQKVSVLYWLVWKYFYLPAATEVRTVNMDI